MGGEIGTPDAGDTVGAGFWTTLGVVLGMGVLTGAKATGFWTTLEVGLGTFEVTGESTMGVLRGVAVGVGVGLGVVLLAIVGLVATVGAGKGDAGFWG
jgi:hypothetical protein